MSDDFVSRLRQNPENGELWAQMYRALRPAVYRTAYSLLRGDVASAEDITQSTFTRFLQYGDLHSLQDDDHLLAYLRQTARRLCFDYRRRQATTVSIDAVDAGATLIADPDRDEEARNLAQDIVQLGKGLSDIERALLQELANETPLTEIAARFSITYSAAAVRVHRLRNKLSIIFNELHINE